MAVIKNKVQKEKGNNIVILNRSAFYPTSGGQVHDKGTITINNQVYNVINVEKVGKCFLHHLEEEIKDSDKVIDAEVHCSIDV